MVNLFMKLRQFSPSSNKGFTLVELLVTTLIASTVLGLSLQLITDQRRQFVGDQLRSESNQTLRSGMDLIAADARIAGDFLQSDSELPVISVIDESTITTPNNNGDILVFQRKMIPDTLKLCRDLSNGQDRLVVSRNPPQDGCGPYSDGDGNDLNDTVDAFRKYRCQADGTDTCETTSPPSVGTCNDESVWAYIHDPVNNRGEFFKYAFERNNANDRNLLFRCDSSAWLYNYTYDRDNFADNPTIYILEEQSYSLNGDVLQLTTNRQAPPLRLTNNVAEFQVDVVTDSATLTAFNPDLFEATDWQSIKYLDVALEAADTSDGTVTLEDSQRQISSKFFPRNALSRD